MTAIEATNRGAADMPWAMLTSSPEVTEVGVRAIDDAPPDAVLVDVREPEEYERGHVKGALSIPQADLATRLGELPRDRPIITICAVGMRSRRSAQFLRQQGFEDVATVVGGMAAWRAARRPVETSGAPSGPLRIAESEWAHAGAITTNPAEMPLPE
jgi:rhodanese-related sulfurtransferase